LSFKVGHRDESVSVSVENRISKLTKEQVKDVGLVGEAFRITLGKALPSL